MERLPARIATLLQEEIERNLNTGNFNLIFNNNALGDTLQKLHALSNISPAPTSGNHLGYVREYIQRKCVNGERVTWGSHDVLKFRNELTVSDMEHLAQGIARAALHEVFGAFTKEVCSVVKTPSDLVDAIQSDKCSFTIKYIADNIEALHKDSPYQVLDTVLTRTRVGQDVCAIVEVREAKNEGNHRYFEYLLFSARVGLATDWVDGSDFCRKESTTLVDLYARYRDRNVGE